MLSIQVTLHAGNAGQGDGVSQALLAESDNEGGMVTLQPEVEDPSVLDWENIGVCIYKVGVSVALKKVALAGVGLDWLMLALLSGLPCSGGLQRNLLNVFTQRCQVSTLVV